jgi:hypothetical protein
MKHTPATPPTPEEKQKFERIEKMFRDSITEQERRANAYPKLVEALREIIEARHSVRTTVQHFHKNRAEVKRDTDAAAKARALLRSLGEDV